MLLLLIAIVDRIEFQAVNIGEELNGRSTVALSVTISSP